MGRTRYEWAHNNPLVELYDAEYVVNIRTVAAHDNYVAINNSISIDLTGQINSETIGTRLVERDGRPDGVAHRRRALKGWPGDHPPQVDGCGGAPFPA